MALTLDINGKPVAIASAPETPLLWVLRDELGLTGAKFGCGSGLCGACTVIVDEAAIRACVTPAGSVAGTRIRTIEGLGGEHPVQQAWLRHDVPQCGYCQSGQILSAVALVTEKPAPTDADIDTAMDGVICRCGTYQRIRAAIHDAAGQSTTPAAPAKPEGASA
jgi:isoquinoline 1-oxidoreductase alpha subunit